MQPNPEQQLQLLGPDEIDRRTARLLPAMAAAGLDGMVVSDLADIYYLTGRVFCGYIYLNADGRLRYYLRRPNNLRGDDVTEIRKPEEMTADIMATFAPKTVGLEDDSLPCSMAARLRVSLPAGASVSAMLRASRAVKTDAEIDLMRRSGAMQTEAYGRIPGLYTGGMTDIGLQIEIERDLRLHGCLGIFRIAGQSMELYMGNVLTGDNSDTPSPYDFAMGGAGLHPSIPVGADGTRIIPGLPVMVDMNGNFTGYMTDMTRCYCVGEPHPEAVRLNTLSRDICAAVAEAAVPGAAARDLYALALGMASDAGCGQYFMGHRHHAGFVGHGIGIEVNELPVLAPRSRDILAAGMTIACEPKFVVPGLGAVGIENTYVVRPDGPAERITSAPEQITLLH